MSQSEHFAFTRYKVYKPNPLSIQLPNGRVLQLPPELVLKQRISEDQVDKILNKHVELFRAKEKAHVANREDDWVARRRAAQQVDKLDSQLQVLWGWDPNPNYRIHWRDIPGCICSPQPTGMPRNIEFDCPFHGVK